MASSLQAEKNISTFSVTVHTSLSAAEDAWRALEERATFAPYQRFDWLSALEAAGAEPAGKVAIAFVHRGRETVGLLPLIIEKTMLHRRARFYGSDQSNTDWMILAEDFQPSPDDLRTIFGLVAKAAGGIDLLLVQNQMPQWHGRPNPLLAMPHQPGASHLYVTSIAGVSRPYLDARIPAKHRGNLRRGRRRLEEASGPVRLVRVEDAELLERAHAAFLEQRSARFSEMGIDNVFASPMFQRFFRDGCAAGFGQRRPYMVAYALMAGDEIVATCWGSMAGDHYSLYINSTTTGPASRYSLMGILIGDLMDQLLDLGITGFDLGLGDFDYKREWTEAHTVYHGLHALTPRGRLAAMAMGRRAWLKRLIKQDPRLWKLVGDMRRLRYRLRNRGGG